MPATSIDYCSIAYEILGRGPPLVLRPGARNSMDMASEPEPQRLADDATLLQAAGVMADFADLKSIYLAGHSNAVAGLTMDAAEHLKLDPAECLMLHVAPLAHDLGRVSVSAATGDKPGPLNDSEWEAVRLHPYYSERLLS
jgi:HD-GYP domain-containing protein (c-di-GMP phosphodiesterase class II)